MSGGERSRIRHFKAHARLLIALAIGLAAGALFGHIDLATRIVLAWNIGVCAFLIPTWYMMLTTDEARLKRKAAEQDEPRTIILAITVAAVLASLGGVVAEIQFARTAAGQTAAVALLLSISTVVLSWLCMHTLFAIHYAHEFYGDHARTGAVEGGLKFTGRQTRMGYGEFAYVAFCIGMTYQVSDFVTGSRKFRWLVTTHAGLSFFYNTFILALVINFIVELGR